ncbi:MAG: transglutaminase family protein [Pseudomonadales bacterium]|nr:transglutaminase family protein [Pseudomonadales bacterium]
MKCYLSATDIIDWKEPNVLALAKEIAKPCIKQQGGEVSSVSMDAAIAKACFEWVRDNINHSWDYKQNPVTCRASSVLTHSTGYCYSKSHLLAALLRANNIPAGFCYQRLSLEGSGPPYCLHGLNAVYLLDYGWYRIDARGNKEGVDAQFTPPVERLAFAIEETLEADLPEIWSEPLPVVVEALSAYDDIAALYDNLPDVELMQRPTS